jgi:hypothetical protein
MLWDAHILTMSLIGPLMTFLVPKKTKSETQDETVTFSGAVTSVNTWSHSKQPKSLLLFFTPLRDNN